MKKLILLMVGLMMLMPAAAQAELITIAIEAQVTEVDDTDGFLQEQINVDGLITGYYRYDSDAPDSSPDNDKVGRYFYSEAPYGIYLSAGGFIFQTDPSDVDFLLSISNGQSGGTDAYGFVSYNNLPLYEGVSVHISLQLNDDSETAVSLDKLLVMTCMVPVLVGGEKGFGCSLNSISFSDLPIGSNVSTVDHKMLP